ncbi:MAG: type II toxin-antitoxin system Phd/YefM family antitoxin [Thermomicrobia bacterium]|nr:type II toxin-antitoxin system Phd/YefM family antitoxin [Thermomicrobia bacterium]
MATKTINERLPVAKVRADLDAVIDHIQETKQPIIVTREGKAAVVIIDAVQYGKGRARIIPWTRARVAFQDNVHT